MDKPAPQKPTLTPFERFVRAIAGVPKEELRQAEADEKREQPRLKRAPKANKT